MKGRSDRRGKITSPASSTDPANRVSRVLWALPRFCGGSFSQVRFPCSGIRFLTSYANVNANANTVYSPGSFWKGVRGLWGFLVALMPLYFLSYSSIPFLCLCGPVLCGPWGSKCKLVPREILSCLLTRPFSSSQSLRHGSAFTPGSPGFYT